MMGNALTEADSTRNAVHLHGRRFFIMAAGDVDAGEFTDEVPLEPTLARDTVTVNANSYLVLRLIADNSGAWIMHCQ